MCRPDLAADKYSWAWQEELTRHPGHCAGAERPGNRGCGQPLSATVPGMQCGQNSRARCRWWVYLWGFVLAVSPGQVFLCRQLKSRVVLICVRVASCRFLVRKYGICLNFSNLQGGHVAPAGCLGSPWNCFLLLICLQAARGVCLINWEEKKVYFPLSSILLG